MPKLTKDRIDLFSRLLENKLLTGDAEQLVEWLGTAQPDDATIALVMQQLQQVTTSEENLSQDVINRLDARLPLIFASSAPKKSLIRTISSNKVLRYAAAIAMLLIAVVLVQQKFRSTKTDGPVILAKSDLLQEIQPGKDGAILTLEDGSTLLLDSLGNGFVTTQQGAQILLRNGQLVYDSKNPTVTQIAYNSMSTPKGRQFRLVLPDGTRVWLNAASSIRYPVAFAGNERLVEMTGEAYFEVAHNKQLPFKVKTAAGTIVEVLGTHFNINSYDNEESINTTLLEGSVKVSNYDGTIILKPGEQALALAAGDIKVKTKVDTEKVMAWKNGIFNFQDASLEEVMRQLERWYDIEVVYEKNIPRLEFYGKMGKDLSLETVLSGLEKSNVHFRLEAGRKLVVLP